jgi:hypothetical protein
MIAELGTRRRRVERPRSRARSSEAKTSTSARTQDRDDVSQNNMIVTVVRAVMTDLERALGRNESEDAVSHVRHLFQKTVEAGRAHAVERLPVRKVIASVTGTNFNPDITSQLFMPDSDVYPTTPVAAVPPQPTRTCGGDGALRAGSFRTRPGADPHSRLHAPAKALGRRIRAAGVGRRSRRGGERCSW